MSPCPWQSNKSTFSFRFPWSPEQAGDTYVLFWAQADRPPLLPRAAHGGAARPPGPEESHGLTRSPVNCSRSPTVHPDTASLPSVPRCTSSPSFSPYGSRSLLTVIYDAEPRDKNAMTIQSVPKDTLSCVCWGTGVKCGGGGNEIERLGQNLPP